MRDLELSTNVFLRTQLWPHNVRVFDQLGLLGACEGRYIALHDKTSTHLDGRMIRTGPIFKYLSEKYVALDDIRHYPVLIQSQVMATRA